MSLDVDKALRRAARLMKNAELTAAETIYKDILTSFPKNSKALRGYQRMKSTDVVTRPERSAPSSQQMQAVMALCHQGQFTEVLSKLDLLLEAFPDASAVYNLQGASRAALGRYDGAVDSFKRAIKLKPDDARSYFNIGNVQKETGALDAAIANYDSALKIKPDHVAALRNKGNVLQDKGDARAAIASYKSAIEIEPKHALTHYQMGFVVSDVLWQRFGSHLPGKLSDAGATAKDNRLFLQAVLQWVRTGSPWRDLLPAFGHLCAHAVGRTTKIIVLVDVLGNLIRFQLLPGQAHDMKSIARLIKDVSFDALRADKAFDPGWLLHDLNERGATAMFPPKADRKLQRNYDADV